MSKILKTKQSHTGAMETRDHSNGAIPKSQKSRGNFKIIQKFSNINKIALFVIIAMFIASAVKL